MKALYNMRAKKNNANASIRDILGISKKSTTGVMVMNG